MGIRSFFRQSKLNKEIERSLTPIEKEGLSLIKYYGSFAINSNMNRGGWLMPPSTPRPHHPGLFGDSDDEPVYATEFLLMKNFLEEHPDYNTSAARAIRKYYGME